MKKCVLGDVADVKVSGVDKKTNEGEIPVRLCNYTDVYYNWAVTSEKYDGLMRASAKPDEISKFKIKKGQVALTKDSETRDDIGIPTYIADDFDDVLLGYHCALISPDAKELSGKYLNALLRTKYVKDFFANNAGGSGQRYYLSDSSIKELPLFLPDITVQRRIGAFLSAIDRKIALNRKRIATLEAMAKEIYEYWFVQFDFPDAHGRPYKSSGGAMVYNPDLKREIPKGWEVKALGEISTFRNGINYEKSEIGDAEYRIVNVRNISESTFLIRHEDLDKIILRQTLADRFLLRSEDIIVARSGTPGATRIILNPERTIFCGFIICCSPIQKAHQILLMQRLQSIQESLLDTSGGSILKNVSQDTLKSIQVELPPDDVLRQFNDTILTVIRSIDNAQRSVVEMSDLRDFLLPLLMNGKVKVG